MNRDIYGIFEECDACQGCGFIRKWDGATLKECYECGGTGEVISGFSKTDKMA